jgi:hypothetical protein
MTLEWSLHRAVIYWFGTRGCYRETRKTHADPGLIFLKMFYCLKYLLPTTGATRLRHEPSSSARTLVSWVRIPLKAWVYVCVYSVFLLFCMYVAALWPADPPSTES